MEESVKKCEFCQKELNGHEVFVSALSKQMTQARGMPVLFDLVCRECCLYSVINGHEALVAKYQGVTR